MLYKVKINPTKHRAKGFLFDPLSHPHLCLFLISRMDISKRCRVSTPKRCHHSKMSSAKLLSLSLFAFAIHWIHKLPWHSLAPLFILEPTRTRYNHDLLSYAPVPVCTREYVHTRVLSPYGSSHIKNIKQCSSETLLHPFSFPHSDSNTAKKFKHSET